MRDKASSIAENLEYDGYQRGLTSMVYKFFDQKTSSGIKKIIKLSPLINKWKIRTQNIKL